MLAVREAYHKGLVSDSLLTTALGIPQGAFQVIFILSGSYLSTRFKNIRTIIMAAYLVPTIIGISLLWRFPRGDNQFGVLFCYYIVYPPFSLHTHHKFHLLTIQLYIQTGSYVTPLVLALQLPSSNTGGYTKRVTSNAMVFLAYCIGNIIGPHAFLSDEALVYKTACKLCFSFAVCQIVCIIALRGLLIWRNKEKDRVLGNSNLAGLDGERYENLEILTDFENPTFRYVL